MARQASRTHLQLVLEAQRVLALSQEQLANHFGSSKRTMQRLTAGKSMVYPQYLTTLAGHVHPRDPALAAELAAAAGKTLQGLGIVKAQPPAPPPPPPMPRHLAADAVVCVAAEGMNVSPVAVRGALLAAFRRARELGLSCEEMERALAGAAAVVSTKSKD